VTGMNTKAGTSRGISGISGIGEINSCVGSYYRKNSSVARCGLFVALRRPRTEPKWVKAFFYQMDTEERRKANPSMLSALLSMAYRHFVRCFRIKCLDAPRRSIKDLRGAPEFSVAEATSISAAPLTIAEGWWAMQVQAMAGGKASERTRNVHLNQ
jgi:hypothetical protein